MFKKSLASIVTAAILVAGPGNLTLTAAAQTMTRGPVTGVSVTPTIGAGLNSPVPGASSFNIPTLTPGALNAPSLTAAPSVAAPMPVAAQAAVPAAAKAVVPATLAAKPLAAAAKAVPATVKSSPLSVIQSRDVKVGAAEKGAALNTLFDNSLVTGHEAIEVLGQSAASVESGLSRSEVAAARTPVSVERASLEKGQSGGLIVEVGVVAAVIAVVAMVSAPFRNLLSRAWNSALGLFGLGVKKLETPEVMAQRIIDQLNAQKPVYNRKVQEASTLVEKLKLQVQSETAKVAELEQGITALLSDSDPANDIMASGMINQQKTLNNSIASTNEQITLAEQTLVSIKEERARFFSEREEMLAKIQAGLTKSQSAEIQKQIAELKGGFQVGDLKDNMDKFEDAVNDKVADAKGTVDSVESNPEEILKKAKDSLKSQEIKDELAKRKAAIEQAKKDKGAAGGAVNKNALRAVGVALNVLFGVWAGLNTGWFAMFLGASAVSGLVFPLAGLTGSAFGAFAAKVMKTTPLKAVGFGVLGSVIGFSVGLVAVGFGGYLGYAVATNAAAAILGGAALLGSVIDLAQKALSKKPAPPTGDDKGQSGGLIVELGVGAAVIAVIAMVSAPFRNLLSRVWNAFLGIFGMGVKKLETPEVMAQRIIDQLNEQKPVYNRKVQEASTLVEKLRLQIEKQSAQSAELDRSVTAILSDSDPLNDVMAESLLNQKKTVDASTAMTKEQLTLSEQTLVSIKEERVRFFSEREEMLAKIQAGLTKSKSAEIQKQIAELKGGFQVGDLKDNMDKFEDAVNDKVADAKGTVDSVDSNPDQILKKAKDSLKNQEVQDEIARRKAAIEQAKKDKGAAGGELSQGKALGYFAKTIGIGFALISPWLSSAVFALLGLFAIAMAPEQGRWLGRQLAGIGLGTLAIGVLASVAVAKLGLAVGAFGVGISFIVPAGIALSIGVIATIRAHKKDGATVASAASTPAGSSVMTPEPTPSATAPAAPSTKISFSIKPLINLLSRVWNAFLGIFGMGVKKLETPEILAQRLIDQLNAAKPVYNNKVREASTLVEKLRQQIAGEVAKIADFDKTITALLSDNDPSNDIQAAGLLNSQKTLEASIASSKEQLALSEQTLASIKEERARFFAEREETLAKIQSGLTKAKAAEITKQIAELKGGFQVGDLKDNMDRFDGAVGDKIADAKGATDAVDSNPDQVLKKAKDSLRTQEIADELARRKAAIEQAKKDKGAAGGEIPGRIWAGVALGAAVEIGALALFGWAAVFPLIAVMGRAGMAAGLIGQVFPDVKTAKLAGTITGGGLAALTAPGLLPIMLGLAAGYVISGMFASNRKLNAGIGDIIGAVLAGMMVGVTLPVWVGAMAAKKSLDNDKGQSGGLIVELGMGAAVIAVVAMISAPFRNLLSRVWNAFLGLFGMGVKKLETPEIMAQRIIDQLNSQKPIYNRKVQEASTLVEKLRLQIEKQAAQSAELDRSVTAILSDSDPLNDVMAESLLNQKKTVDASTAMSKEQLTISEQTLVSIKEERARFFSEREEMLAKIQAGLTKSKSAEIQKQIAELKGGFQIGDLKDNMDKFEDAVNDKVADAKGTVDSVDSNPDQILKKAKDSLKNQEVQDEIAKRKAAIEQAKKDKGQAAGEVPGDVPMTATEAEQGLLSKTYSWMALGLGISAAAAQAAIVTGVATTILASLPMVIALAIAQIGLVIWLSLAIRKLSPGAALTGFLVYSGLTGLFLAPVVAMFTAASVAAAFLVTAGMFGTMAIIGHTTKMNLNSVGSYGMMALTGIILASFVNIFLHSTGLAAVLTYASILVFVGLTAYDAQKIKEMAQKQGTLSKDDVSRIAVMGALTLYLDFINLFINILKLIGKAKSK